ncbi:polyubiquitin-like [Hippoglossus stenolepis]|uniref:polyubiquitin-like n=1 Tax=Hippoglossus stenolepis TaxID=195615 RepID=UPI00159C491E|nr:polyubiquitin-like [Hippoglossus stenolepis]
MDLIITMLNGKTVDTLRVDPQDTVGSLKQVLQQKMGVPVERQRLVFDNGQLIDLSDDLRTVGSYGLHAGSRLSLLVIEPSPPSRPATFQVFLRNEKNEETPYDITSDETVSDFKHRVQCREGVAVTQQRLVFQGREMTAGKLSDYNVQAQSTIELLMRLRGGN